MIIKLRGGMGQGPTCFPCLCPELAKWVFGPGSGQPASSSCFNGLGQKAQIENALVEKWE